jgi:hypothetical protein
MWQGLGCRCGDGRLGRPAATKQGGIAQTADSASGKKPGSFSYFNPCTRYKSDSVRVYPYT